MPILLAIKYPDIKITAVEIQSELAQIARKNIEINNLADKIRLLNNDIMDIQVIDVKNPGIHQYSYSNKFSYIGDRFDRVIANPPYKKRGSGRLNPDTQKAIARHEIALTLDELILSVCRFLKHNGTFNLIYPANRLTELLVTMKNNLIEPADVKFIDTSYMGKYKQDIETINMDKAEPNVKQKNLVPNKFSRKGKTPKLVIVTGIKQDR